MRQSRWLVLGLTMAVDLGCDPPNLSSRRNTNPGRAQLAPLAIRSLEKITFGSDSLTTGFNGALSWPTGTGNFNDQVNAILGGGNHIVDVENGQAGSGIDYLATNLNTLIINSAPTMVILWVGVNDAAAGTDSFTDKYITVLARIKAALPGVKIACIGLGVRQSEVWTIDASTGLPVWNPAQPSINVYDAYVAQAAASMGCMFIDWRKWLLAWEVINNPGQVATGIATVDGTHYNDAGQKQLAACILQSKYLSVAP